jgi:glutamate transport system permease protein
MTAVLYDVLGPRARRRAHAATVVFAIVTLGLLAWVLVLLRGQGQLDGSSWSILANADFLRLMLSGLWSTLEAASLSMILAFGFGLVMATAQLLGPWPVRAVVRVWIEVFRGLPLMLLIFFIYLGAPAVGVDVSTFWALVVALTLFGSSVISEIIRAGVLSLPKGQREAAESVGLRGRQAFRYVLLPQAVRRMLPTLISQLVILLKGSSLGFVIGYTELLRNGRTAIEYLGGSYSLPIFTGVAAIYIAVNMLLSWVATAIDRRNRTRGQGAGGATTTVEV